MYSFPLNFFNAKLELTENPDTLIVLDVTILWSQGDHPFYLYLYYAWQIDEILSLYLDINLKKNLIKCKCEPIYHPLSIDYTNKIQMGNVIYSIWITNMYFDTVWYINRVVSLTSQNRKLGTISVSGFSVSSSFALKKFNGNENNKVSYYFSQIL